MRPLILTGVIMESGTAAGEGGHDFFQLDYNMKATLYIYEALLNAHHAATSVADKQFKTHKSSAKQSSKSSSKQVNSKTG